MDIIELVEAGAAGFILKDATIEDFLETIRSVARGMKVLPPLLTGSLFTHVVDHALRQGKGKLPEAVRMTKREREIIVLIAEGMSNKEIAQRLNLSTYTVKSHVHNILEKLALHSRLEIAAHFHKTRRGLSPARHLRYPSSRPPLVSSCRVTLHLRIPPIPSSVAQPGYDDAMQLILHAPPRELTTLSSFRPIHSEVLSGILYQSNGRIAPEDPQAHEQFEQWCLKGNRPMNWDRMEGEWKQRRGKAVHHWGKMMNDELAAIAGKYEELVGKAPSTIRDREGGMPSVRLDEFKKMVDQLKKSNNKLIEAQKALRKQKDGTREKARSTSPARKRNRLTPRKATS